MLDLFLAIFLIAFSCAALVVGIFAARFGEAFRRTMGFIYVFIGIVGFLLLLWLFSVIPLEAPEPFAFGFDRLFLGVFLLFATFLGTAAGLAIVFLVTLSPE